MICDQNENTECLLVCDHCNYSICHIQCLSPPIDYIPEEDWYCNNCTERFNLRNSWAEPVFANFEEFDTNIDSSLMPTIESGRIRLRRRRGQPV